MQLLLRHTKSMTSNLNATHNAAWRVFLTTHAQLINLIEQELAQAELPPLAWYDVLLALAESCDHRLRMHELAAAMVLDRSNLTRLVDRLEAKGLVCRKSCPSDRRGAYAEITEAGLAMRQRMWPVYEQALAKYFARHLDDTEVAVFNQALQRILASVTETADKSPE